MKGYMNGGPDLVGNRMLNDAQGVEMQIPYWDSLGHSPLMHVWVPTLKVVTDLAHGQYRIWEYFGLVYRDAAVGPRKEDKAKADLRQKWWQVESLMEELGVRLELRVRASASYVESSIDFYEGPTFIEIDSHETDLY